jgi:quaternary ammonium compound-resistance protein SugE
MGWIYLLFAGLFEIGWALGLKLSDGFTRPWPTAFTAVSLLLSMALLGLALRTLPLGTAYAVWTGIGAVGIAIVGMHRPDCRRHRRPQTLGAVNPYGLRGGGASKKQHGGS